MESKQEDAERNETKGAFQVIQGPRLSQEKDDDDGLEWEEASAKRESNNSKKKTAGSQVPAILKRRWGLWMERKQSRLRQVWVWIWPPSLQAHVEQAPSIMSAAAASSAV